ncbi:translation termination factor eRF1 [Bonamia ostreae]|uniref:Translation termination factor eRF1 n=1 Tax=Bonamia ostreae TaxID=126728 RepID=A0ABV2ASP4_9EUKA
MSYGTKLNFVTDCSQEGGQFVRGFGGIGGILRYQLNFDDLVYQNSEDSDF